MKNKEKITFEEAMESFIPEYVEVEDKFILPKLWYLKITSENKDIINNWRRNIIRYDNSNCKYETISGDGSGSSINFITKYINYEEITFEQFKKYVLKEEIIEEKIIEPLPQFKVIESVETITKVENNEGNQFFIGDKIIIISGDLPHIIKGFKYYEGNMVVITDSTELDINDIEHYIEPKVEFILPEKWCIKQNSRIINDWLNKNKETNTYYSSIIDGQYIHFPAINNIAHLHSNIQNGYIEITLDQFKKYILKKEVIEETLLEKAKRLYPIGTKYKCQFSKKLFIVNFQNFRKISNNKIYGENNKGCLLDNNIWAEIIK